jgi:hypothetical protein
LVLRTRHVGSAPHWDLCGVIFSSHKLPSSHNHELAVARTVANQITRIPLAQLENVGQPCLTEVCTHVAAHMKPNLAPHPCNRRAWSRLVSCFALTGTVGPSSSACKLCPIRTCRWWWSLTAHVFLAWVRQGGIGGPHHIPLIP